MNPLASKDDGFVTREHCPACAGDEFAEIYRATYDQPPIADYLRKFYSRQGGVELEYLERAQYVLEDCRRCGMVFQRHIPSDALLAKLYESWIDPAKQRELYEQNHDHLHYRNIAEMMMALAQYFGVARPAASLRYLDFGMGWADWARMAAAFGNETYGTEISPTRRAYALRLGLKVIDESEMPAISFDVIHADQVFEHLARPLEVLRLCAASLRPGGLIYVAVPDGTDIRQRLAHADWSAGKEHGASLNAVAPLEHVNCFSRRSLEAMAAKARLKPYVPPRNIEWAASTGTVGLRWVKNLLRPYRHPRFNRPTALFFTHEQ